MTKQEIVAIIELLADLVNSGYAEIFTINVKIEIAKK